MCLLLSGCEARYLEEQLSRDVNLVDIYLSSLTSPSPDTRDDIVIMTSYLRTCPSDALQFFIERLASRIRTWPRSPTDPDGDTLGQANDRNLHSLRVLHNLIEFALPLIHNDASPLRQKLLATVVGSAIADACQDWFDQGIEIDITLPLYITFHRILISLCQYSTQDAGVPSDHHRVLAVLMRAAPKLMESSPMVNIILEQLYEYTMELLCNRYVLFDWVIPCLI